MVDLNRAGSLTPEIEAQIDDMFEYHAWDVSKQGAGLVVRRALAEAVKLIVVNVPACPDRSTAIRKIREARMDANSAITHGGKY
jgi:site-specific recombinase